MVGGIGLPIVRETLRHYMPDLRGTMVTQSRLPAPAACSTVAQVPKELSLRTLRRRKQKKPGPVAALARIPAPDVAETRDAAAPADSSMLIAEPDDHREQKGVRA